MPRKLQTVLAGEDNTVPAVHGQKRQRAKSHIERIYRSYSDGAKSRGLAFELNPRQAYDLFASECFYCGRKPGPIIISHGIGKREMTYKYNGIDRVDSQIGYEPGNCVSCCSVCNRMKFVYPVELFFDQIRKIYWRHIRPQGDNDGSGQ